MRTVPNPPASTTAGELSRRFGPDHLAGIEAGLAQALGRSIRLMDDRQQQRLLGQRPTIDIDPTDVEVYGLDKQQVGFNYAGVRCARPVPATWAQAGVALAAELISGDEDPCAAVAGLVARAVAALPEGTLRPVIRVDAGLFDGKIAQAALDAGADYAIAAKRNKAVWRAIRQTPEDAWKPAVGLEGGEVARISYVPGGWPAGSWALARRVRVKAQDISTDPRARRRRSIDPEQLRLALGGDLDEVYAYSVIVTNLDWDPVSIEVWFRCRTQVEERIKDSKAGMALRHLPSGYAATNAVWMWAALTALNLSALMQALAQTDCDGRGRAHGKRLRRELLCVPGRVVTHAGQTTLRLAADSDHLVEAYTRIRALPVAA